MKEDDRSPIALVEVGQPEIFVVAEVRLKRKIGEAPQYLVFGSDGAGDAGTLHPVAEHVAGVPCHGHLDLLRETLPGDQVQ